jgi:cyanophycinase
VNNETGPLALIGGGEWTEGCTFDRLLIEATGATEVLVVPAAAAYEHPERVMEKATTWFREMGVAVRELPVLTRSDAENPAHADEVINAKLVYVSDGSPLHLRSVLKDSVLWTALVKAWRTGTGVACSAAAATVFGDPMVDPRGGTFTLGLGIARGLAVVPQWERWTGDRARRMNHLIPSDVAVAEIEERTALIRWGDGTWQIDGFGRVTLTRNHQALQVDELESLIDTGPLHVPSRSTA